MVQPKPIDSGTVIGPGIPPAGKLSFEVSTTTPVFLDTMSKNLRVTPNETHSCGVCGYSSDAYAMHAGSFGRYCPRCDASMDLPKPPEQKPLPGFEGLGPDAEVETNANGGMQSKSPSALHLVDPGVLRLLFEKYKLDDTCDLCSDQEHVDDTVANAGVLITVYMLEHSSSESLLDAMILLCDGCPAAAAFKAGEVLLYGATKGNNGKGYPVNNWRKIPREEHINHALNHIVGYLGGDRTDDHLDHAVCRLGMALATEETNGFWYTKEPTKKADF